MVTLPTALMVERPALACQRRTNPSMDPENLHSFNVSKINFSSLHIETWDSFFEEVFLKENHMNTSIEPEHFNLFNIRKINFASLYIET